MVPPGLDLRPSGQLIGDHVPGVGRIQEGDIGIASHHVHINPGPDPGRGRISGHVIKGQGHEAMVAIEIIVKAITSEYKRYNSLSNLSWIMTQKKILILFCSDVY